jgi:hypothetical protein
VIAGAFSLCFQRCLLLWLFDGVERVICEANFSARRKKMPGGHLLMTSNNYRFLWENVFASAKLKKKKKPPQKSRRQPLNHRTAPWPAIASSSQS